MITRRNFSIGLGSSLVALTTLPPSSMAAPLPGKVVRLGLLSGIRDKFDPGSNAIDRAIAESLRAQGYEIGRNVAVEFRSAGGNPERLPSLAAELAQLKIDMFLTIGSQPTLTAFRAAKGIPIVAIGITDPVETNLVQSLARPGGSVTGLAINASDISAKRVQLLKAAVPKFARVAVLWNSTFQSMSLQFQQVEVAAPTLGVTVQSIRVASSDDFERAFDAIKKNRPDGLIVLFGPMRGNDLPRIVEFVTQNRIPALFELGQGIRGGGLMEFGADFADLARQVGPYVDRIANGSKAADLPIAQPTKFELFINMKAAHTMGLTIPPSLLLRADKVIE